MPTEKIPITSFSHQYEFRPKVEDYFIFRCPECGCINVIDGEFLTFVERITAKNNYDEKIRNRAKELLRMDISKKNRGV